MKASSRMTHEAYFGLLNRPFQGPPQDDMFVPLEPFAEAIRQLCDAAIKGDGIGVITAEPGLGKTVVCRQVQTRLEAEFATVFLPSCNFPTRRSLLQAVLHAQGIEYAGLTEQETRLKVLESAHAVLEDRKGLVLIVDEAHQLGARLLEELRSLTNHVEHGQPLIRVILSGQLSLEELLTKPELQSLNYRITCHATLDPLTMRESARYIDERLARVGGDACTLFSSDALEMLCRISDGNPRCLNQISDACLSYAAETEQETVDPTVVRVVLQDLKQLPLQWNESACDQLSNEVDGEDQIVEHDIDSPELPTAIHRKNETRAATPRPECERRDTENSHSSGWSSNVVSIEVGGETDATVDVPARNEEAEVLSTPPVSRKMDHSGHQAEVQELVVEDRYACLDRQTAGTNTNVYAERQTRRPVAPVPTLQQPDLTTDELDESSDEDNLDSAEESINRVIQAVSDIVAQEMAKDSYRAGGSISDSDDDDQSIRLRPTSWRFTPDPSQFDVVEPETDDAPADPISPMEQNGLTDHPPRTALSPAAPPAAEDVNPSSNPAGIATDLEFDDDAHLETPQRPYARLFSRVRRLRSTG